MTSSYEIVFKYELCKHWTIGFSIRYNTTEVCFRIEVHCNNIYLTNKNCVDGQWHYIIFDYNSFRDKTSNKNSMQLCMRGHRWNIISQWYKSNSIYVIWWCYLTRKPLHKMFRNVAQDNRIHVLLDYTVFCDVSKISTRFQTHYPEQSGCKLRSRSRVSGH